MYLLGLHWLPRLVRNDRSVLVVPRLDDVGLYWCNGIQRVFGIAADCLRYLAFNTVHDFPRRNHIPALRLFDQCLCNLVQSWRLGHWINLLQFGNEPLGYELVTLWPAARIAALTCLPHHAVNL